MFVCVLTNAESCNSCKCLSYTKTPPDHFLVDNIETNMEPLSKHCFYNMQNRQNRDNSE